MRFAKGYFGACVVVLAILGTAMGGFFLSLERTTETVESYNYITDVSGLFDYTNEPEYVEYNPSTNYVGYISGSADPQYEQTTQANNYRYILDQPPDRSLGSSLAIGSTAPNHGDYGPMATAGGNTMVQVDSSTIYPGTIGSGKITSLGYFLNLWFENFDPTPYSKLILNTSYSPNNSPVYFYCGNWERIYQNDIAFWYAETTEESAKPVKLIIDVSSLRTYAYNSSDDLLWQDVAYNVGCIHIYRTSFSGGAATTSVTLLGTAGTPLPIYGYMNPNNGVTLSNAGYINWSNDYQNNEITIKFVKPSNTAWVELTVNGSSFRIGWYQGKLQFWNLAPAPDTIHTVFGDWIGAQITLHGADGSVEVTPLYNDLSLTTVANTTAYTQTFDGVFAPGDITSIRFMNPNGGETYPHWQIVRTKVFLNTYNTVMQNPSINILNYFPDLDDYRLNFFAFAIYGSTFNINGVSFTVNKTNATVTFTIDDADVTQPLNNLYVTERDGNTYITFINQNKTYDLGETTTHVISFVGYWYFTTGLYEPFQTQQTVYTWDIDGTFHANAGQCLMIFLGIILLCVMVGKVYGGINPNILDWLVMIFAVFLAFSVLGGLIE